MCEWTNIYALYGANSNRAGFWVRRCSWGRSVAYVLSIGGEREGPLPGEPPYHGNAKVWAAVCYPDRMLHEFLRCPGCWQWTLEPGPLGLAFDEVFEVVGGPSCPVLVPRPARAAQVRTAAAI